MIYVLLANGFEEVEAIAPVDILKRAGIDVKTVGVSGDYVLSSHGMCIKADISIADADLVGLDGIILPGGMPGTVNLQNNERVIELVKYCEQNGLLISAICAAPMILGDLGLLTGKEAVCFPGFEEHLKGAKICDCKVSVSGNIITASGAGAALEFGAAIVDFLSGSPSGKSILAQMQYPMR